MEKIALLVIDVQVGLVHGAHNETGVVAAINRAISSVRAKHGVVVFIQHCHASFAPLMKGNPGWDLHAGLERETHDLVVEKTASDSFFNTNLEKLLRDEEVNHLFVTGLQTEYCVDTTCRSALSREFDVTLVSDGHTTGDSHMSAADIIGYHNSILSNLAHPSKSIKILDSESL